ncbi:hypothetical protein [Alistipes sp.]|uniref:hypothetical protein n=1 Tax=Alistipes sp. TaxID=1872444 RepID=UPI003AF07726
MTLRGPVAGLAELARFTYGARLRLDGERLLPDRRGIALREGSRIRLEPETMLLFTSVE